MEAINFKKIMVATDGSACSGLVAEKGIELARLSGGKIYAVYVVSTDYLVPINGDSFPMSLDPYWESIHEAWKTQGHKAVNSVKNLGEKKGINVEPVLLEGNPSEELIGYAEEEKMDIIVMGTLGKTGLDKLLLGSVAEKMVRHSKVPVMVVRDNCKL
jgi:nucleotide-binding universal stress UspA family protein